MCLMRWCAWIAGGTRARQRFFRNTFNIHRDYFYCFLPFVVKIRQREGSVGVGDIKLVILSFFVLISGAYSLAALASSDNVPGNYSSKGADTCLQCHDEDYKYPVLEIFFTKHGNRNDPRTPMAKLQCESCHGPGGEHAKEPYVGQKRAAIISFAKGATADVDKQNAMCMSCHRDSKRMVWESSAHKRQGLACADCHVLHTRNDAALSRKAQADVCLNCHNKQRAEFARPSAHPVRQGKINCGDCHNPHGTLDDSMLKISGSKNMTCYACHAEKRGPFLWAHAPVAEDCGICHEHHGALSSSLLNKRQPLLCQQCHSQAGHPSIGYDGSSLTDANESKYILGKSCLNCHSQVHGSNHPSGAKLLR